MSYRQEMDATLRHVGAVLARGERLTGSDLDAAAAGFNATAALLRTVHADLVGKVGVFVPKDIVEAERRPALLLGRLLRELPRLEQSAPSDVLTRPAATATGRHWQAAARTATLAEHAWASASPGNRPQGAAARGELAQLASLAEGLAVAGADLPTDLRAAGRTPEAARLRQATTSGLRVAASATRWEALRGAGPVIDLPPAPSQRVLALRWPSHVPAGLRRLAALLDGAHHVSPQHVQLVAGAVSKAALNASRLLEGAGHALEAGIIGTHARLLADIAGAGRLAASLEPGDARPLAQAQEIHRVLTHGRGQAPLLAPVDAAAIVRSLPQVSRALDAAALRQIRVRRWLAPTGGPGQPLWQTAHGTVPRLSARLDAVADHIGTLESAVRSIGSPRMASRVADLRTMTATQAAQPAPSRAPTGSPRAHGRR